jgi:2'-phosphotransferase
MSTNKNYQNIRISKCMSYILRHGINDRSIKMDNEGYILMSDLMLQPEMKDISIEDIKFIVENNDKKRFSLKEDLNTNKLYIRANQGHSKEIGDKISDSMLLKEIKEPLQICIHGTNLKAWKIIEKEGLSPMKRKHIHLAMGLPDDSNVISGMRTSAKVIIHIDMKMAMDMGKKFYLSDNNVILTPDNLEPSLFKKIVFTKNKKIKQIKQA